MQHLTIYGDFNCPYSYLASTRGARLEERGLVTIEWRAVEHAPSIPTEGHPVRGAIAAQLAREIDEVADLAGAALPLPIRAPRILPNTRAAALALASVDPLDAPALRRAIFTALWVEGRDIGDPAELAALTGGREVHEPTLAPRWRSMWLGIDRPVVPLLMLTTGIVLRGIDALERLEVIGAGGLPERRRRLRRASRAERPARPSAVRSLLGEVAS